MKHTPGPWQQFDDGGAVNDICSLFRHAFGPEYADCVWGPEGPGHGLIADCSPHGQRSTEETIANARLVAAAPDLLAACHWLLDAIGDKAINEHMIYAKSMANVAIAKAIGKEQTP